MTDLQNIQEYETFTIANNQPVSDSISISLIRARGVAVEIAASEWTAADLVIEVSRDNSNWFPLRDAEGNRAKVTGISTTAAGLYVFPAAAWAVGGAKFMRLRSVNTSDETANVNQGAVRTLEVWFLA